MQCRCIIACAFLSGLLLGCERPDQSAEPSAERPEARRIISLAPNITELIYAAGAGEKLVGVVEYSDYPVAAQSLRRVGDSFRVDYEAVSALQPDLILAWESGNPAEVIARLKELGYQVVALETTGLDSIAEQMLVIGELANTNEAAVQAAEAFRQRLADFRNRDLRLRKSVYWQIAADPYFSVTGQHVINEIIELCGGSNIFADLPGLAPPITLEAILAARPEVIIASSKDNDWKQGWERWAELPAVRDGNLYSVDPDIVSRSGPRIIDGTAVVCAAISAAQN